MFDSSVTPPPLHPPSLLSPSEISLTSYMLLPKLLAFNYNRSVFKIKLKGREEGYKSDLTPLTPYSQCTGNLTPSSTFIIN